MQRNKAAAVRGYFQNHKFGTAKGCAEETGVSVEYVRNIIQSLRRDMLEYRGSRGKGYYVLKGLESQQTSNRLKLMHQAAEKYRLMRSQAPVTPTDPEDPYSDEPVDRKRGRKPVQHDEPDLLPGVFDNDPYVSGMIAKVRKHLGADNSDGSS